MFFHWLSGFKYCGLAMVLALAGTCLAERASAQGNLLVTPRRIVFEGGTRIRELNLANIGSDSARFVISLMEIRMKPDGAFERIAEPDSGQRFSSPYLRIYPRSVVIGPGESQMVKVHLTKTDGLDSGEYRSHVYIRAAQAENESDAAPAANREEIAVKLTAVFGISVPAIIRVGPQDVDVTLHDAVVTAANPLKPHIAFTMRRAGRMSSYGDLSVSCVSANGREAEVGVVRGVAIYTPNASRRFEMDLDMTRVAGAGANRLIIRYNAQKEDRYRDSAELSLNLP